MQVKFPTIDKYIREGDVVVTSDESSKSYINIPQLMSEYGPGLVGSLKMRGPVIHKMIGCMLASQVSASSIAQNPRQGNTMLSQQALIDLEAYIHGLGIQKVGYTTVPPAFIFKDHSILYGQAIVLIMEMQPEEMGTAPSKRALKEVFRTYHGLGVTVNKVATYLRERGYNAMAGPAIGGDVNYVSLAERAGLGAIGRHGLLITEENFGPSLRIATVYTDIENLPYHTENPHLWVKEFCEKCGKCIQACPAQAIYTEMLSSGRCIDQTKCAVPFASDYGCSVCIKACTFFKHDYHMIKKRFGDK